MDWNQPIDADSNECPLCGSQQLNHPPHFEQGRLNCAECAWNGKVDYSV